MITFSVRERRNSVYKIDTYYKMKTFLKIIVVVIILMTNIMIAKATERPDRVILFMIDGLHWEAPQKLNMPVLNALKKEGTYVEKSFVIIPHHPTVGDYSKFNSCSFPNTMLHAGTIFLRPENRMLQEVFAGKNQTAFVVNVAAYRTVSKGFTTTIMDPTLNDDQVVAQSIALLNNQDPIFTRIHLQTPGYLGQAVVAASSPDKPYYRNIFGKDSPYVVAVENADKLLGKFINYLKESGKWEHTVLIVTSDHGQSNLGWHPLFDEDSWVTPFVVVGPGIAKGRELPYLEHTDIAPTIAWLLGVEAPNKDGGAGKPVKEILQQYDAENYHPDRSIQTINQQIKEFNFLKARMILKSEKQKYFGNIIASLENEILTPEPFYHQDRIMDWYKAGSTRHMIESNEKRLKEMRSELEK